MYSNNIREITQCSWPRPWVCGSFSQQIKYMSVSSSRMRTTCWAPVNFWYHQPFSVKAGSEKMSGH